MRLSGGTPGSTPVWGAILFVALAWASPSPAAALPSKDSARAIDRYIDAGLEQAAERHGAELERLLPDSAITPAFRRHWSAWRESLQQDATHVGCARALAWTAFAGYLGVAGTVSLALAPQGFLAFGFVPPAALVLYWLGLPKPPLTTEASATLRAFQKDLEQLRYDHSLVAAVGTPHAPWTTEAFQMFREKVRERFDAVVEFLTDSIDQRSHAGFDLDPDTVDRWVRAYFEAWDLATFYEIESRRYAGSALGAPDSEREAQEREWYGISADELRTAIVMAAGGVDYTTR